MDGNKQAAGRALEKGVAIRLIVELQGAPSLDLIKVGMKRGSVAVKTVPSVITERTMITDNKEAYITVSSDRRQDNESGLTMQISSISLGAA